MTILRDASLACSSLFSLIILAILFDSRYPPKKTLRLMLCWMMPLLLGNIVLLVLLGPQKMSLLLLLTCSLPSLLFFWFLSKHRDGRFFFTFCLVDTLVLEVIYISALLDFFLGNRFIVMFAAQLILCPLLTWAIFKWVRPLYLDLQNTVFKGWYVFASIALIFYALMSVSISVPTMITQRLEQLPAFVLQLILMPTIYIHIFNTLRQQQEIHRMREQENILKLQVAGIAARVAEYSAANEKFRMERHDFRHKMQTIASMVETGQFEALRTLVLEYHEATKKTQVKRYCAFAVLDAVLSSYLQKAEEKGVRTAAHLVFPEPLPVGETELATVFANAMENAIHACEKLPEEKREMGIKVITTPHFMLQISNRFDGVVEFDKDGLPISRQEGHGFGTRSIAAFCEKYGAFYEFKATRDTFYLRITFE
ncbi:MAG: GHKL domain-containing protein [Clostridiales bacterium]|nr:GHKL domain-containing protein [Clostridiales bacterium]